MSQRGNSLRPPPQAYEEDQHKDGLGPVKKDTLKIRTNPKYRCVDDGSEDGEDPLLGKGGDEMDALSSKELDFRETIIKFEKKKRRKERRILERQQKKIRANTSDEPGTTNGSTKTASGEGDEDEEDESQSKSSVISEESESND